MYLLNYINKLEFLLQRVRKERKREAKKIDKRIQAVVKSLFPSDASKVARYIGLVGQPTEVLKGSLVESS